MYTYTFVDVDAACVCLRNVHGNVRVDGDVLRQGGEEILLYITALN